jgi:hypothetical protein
MEALVDAYLFSAAGRVLEERMQSLLSSTRLYECYIVLLNSEFIADAV